MKIAVTSTGTTLDAQVDPRFGRAAYILVVDSEDGSFTALDNQENVNAFKGAGIQAAGLISRNGAEVLLTGYCGPNAFKTLKAAGVKVVNDVQGTAAEAVNAFREGSYTYAEDPNTEGHW